MLGRTHLAFGIFVSIIFLAVFEIKDETLFIAAVVFFSIFPDIDSPSSRLGRVTKPLSNIISRIFGHRGLLHSVLMMLAIYIGLLQLSEAAALGALIGYSSHLLLDMITKSGVALFYPIRFSARGIFDSAGLTEKLMFFSLVLIDIVLIAFRF